jgi:signal peptidase
MRIAANVIAGLIFGVALVLLISTQVFGYRIAAIASDSMRPTLNAGDLIVTRPAPITDVASGDVVLFETGTGTRILVAHRVVSTTTLTTQLTDSKTGQQTLSETKVFRTKGDANDVADQGQVDTSNYRGKLLLVIPGIGSSFSSPTPFIVITIVIAGLWLVVEVVRWLRRPRQSSDGDVVA